MCRDCLSLGFNFSLWWMRNRPRPANSSGLPHLCWHASWVRTQEMSQPCEEKLRLAGRRVSGLAPQPHHLGSAQPALHILTPLGGSSQEALLPNCLHFPPASRSSLERMHIMLEALAPLPEHGSPVPQKEHELFRQRVQS